MTAAPPEETTSLLSRPVHVTIASRPAVDVVGYR
ncbi:hypothetical protein JYK04_00366 [Streptomyces nojiriensis]|nr:hypothetical protein JYK04_00366 [Streptomyces nojiriensis]